MNTPLTILLILVVIGGIVVALDRLPTRTQSVTISTRDLPNTAATISSTISGAVVDSNEVVTWSGVGS